MSGRSFGARVQQLREETHMTRKEVAEACGVSLRAVECWLAGGDVRGDQLCAVARAFRVRTDWLLGLEEKE